METIENAEKIKYLQHNVDDVQQVLQACQKELSKHKHISAKRKLMIQHHRKSIFDLNEAIRRIKETAKEVQPEDEQPITL